MSRLDLIVFGATGFTGKHAIFNLVRFAQKHNLTWGIAGRSESKLKDILSEASKKNSGEDLSHIRVIVAEVDDDDSLKRMCSECKVIVNCCGPYRLYGEPVVRAAIHSKTHYVDVTGEPQFMETMQIRYGEEARSAGVFVVSACGWDSVPTDMGVVYLQDNFPGVLNSVESYVKSKIPREVHWQARSGLINGGTWDSLVHSLVHMDELATLRKQMYPEPLPAFKPKLQRKIVHKHGNGYCVPFPGSDEPVVYRTQRHLYEQTKQRPAQLRAYFVCGNIFYTIFTIFAALLIYLMTRFEFTTKLLLEYPRIFSFGTVTRDGPSEVVNEKVEFEFELVGKGWGKEEDVGRADPDKEMTVTVSGKNPGYGATVMALLVCAFTILKEQDKMPATKGVMTTGVAFRKTNIIKNLNENGIKFQIVGEK